MAKKGAEIDPSLQPGLPGLAKMPEVRVVPLKKLPVRKGPKTTAEERADMKKNKGVRGPSTPEASRWTDH